MKSRNLTIGILTPNCYIGVIKEANKVTFDSLTSQKAKKKLLESTQEALSHHLAAKEVTTDTATYRKIYQEIFAINTKLNSTKSKPRRQQIVDSCRISRSLDSLMQVNGVDQLIISYQQGFYRTKTNYRQQSLKGAGVGLLTLGLYMPVPIGASSLILTWVVDRGRQSLVFTNFHVEQNHPTNSAYLKQQVCELYQRFYTATYSNGICYPF
ncbi:hypothetical protein GCM10028808_47680 [Spirosoma migulaei]